MNWFITKAYAVDYVGWLIVKNKKGGGINDLTTNIIIFISGIAAALAVIYLIYSGILYITAAGNPDAAKKGQQGILNAIIGIVVIAAAYFIATAVSSASSTLTK